MKGIGGKRHPAAILADGGGAGRKEGGGAGVLQVPRRSPHDRWPRLHRAREIQPGPSAPPMPFHPSTRTMTLPPRTSMPGVPLSWRVTVTTGLLSGGGGGSENSVVTVAAGSWKRTRTVPRRTSMPPDGAGPVMVMSGGAPALAEVVGDGQRGDRPGPGAGIGALADRGDECVADMIGGLPAFAGVGLLDGGTAGVLDVVGLDRDGGVAVDGEAGLHRVGAHATAPAGAGGSGANVTETLPLATVMETSRSWGTTQKISRKTASAMVCFCASSSDASSLTAMCIASSSNLVFCVS